MGIVHDSARGRIVLFGGRGRNGGPIGEHGDTWEWDGTTWTQVGPGSLARMGHAMAFDRLRNRTVVFGGQDYTGPLPGVAVEWDGTAWQWSSATGPGPGFRFGTAMCYDGTRRKVVLFGGVQLTAMDDTWTYDGSTWQQLAGTGPPARANHALAFDEARGVVVLFGGGSAGARDDTWELTGTGWRAVAPAVRPPARYGHALAYDSRRGRTVLLGGWSGANAALGDTWEFDGAAWTPTSPATAPSPRGWHGLAYDSDRGEVIAFGGTDSGAFGDGATWSYHPVASYTQAGSGCSGTAAAPGLAAVAGPRIGAVLTIDIAPLPAAPFLSFLVVGFTDPQQPLCLLGRCDCTLSAAPDHSLPLVVNQGRAVWSLAIPLATDLIGLTFRNQVAVLDASLRLDAVSGAGVGEIGAR